MKMAKSMKVNGLKIKGMAMEHWKIMQMKYIWVEKAFTLKYLGYWQYDKMNGCGHLKNKNF